MRGSFQTLLCQTLLQSLFIVVHTHGGSTAITAQLVQEAFSEQTKQLLSDFSLLSVVNLVRDARGAEQCQFNLARHFLCGYR